MKTKITATYLVCIHILLAIIFLKSDFIDRVEHKLGYHQTAEITEHFEEMLRYHKRMDGNVPDNAVIFIGDSITQGLCVTAISSTSVNYGIGGDTTYGVLQRLQNYKSIERASAIVLAIGINDVRRRSNGEILDNYHAIIKQLPKAIPIILSAILPLDEELGYKWQDDWHGLNQGRIKDLNSGIKNLAKTDNRFFFVNASPQLIDSSKNLADEYHDGDGIHLNSRGNSIWIDILRRGLEVANKKMSLDKSSD